MKCLVCLVEPCFYLLCTSSLRFSVVSLLHILCRGQHNIVSSIKMVEEISVKCLFAGGDSLLCVANQLPSRCFFREAKEMEIIGPHAANQTYNLLQHHGWEVWWPTLVTILIMTCSDFHLIGPFKKFLVGRKFVAGANCHFLAADTWHQFLLCQDTSLDEVVGQMIKCRLWLRGGLVYRLLPVFHVGTEVRMKCSASKCLLSYIF